jgi:hypothetical protein
MIRLFDEEDISMTRMLFFSCSLMPEGVEHDSLESFRPFAEKLLIIDAIRRYFLIHPIYCSAVNWVDILVLINKYIKTIDRR